MLAREPLMGLTSVAVVVLQWTGKIGPFLFNCVVGPRGRISTSLLVKKHRQSLFQWRICSDSHKCFSFFLFFFLIGIYYFSFLYFLVFNMDLVLGHLYLSLLVLLWKCGIGSCTCGKHNTMYRLVQSLGCITECSVTLCVNDFNRKQDGGLEHYQNHLCFSR